MFKRFPSFRQLDIMDCGPTCLRIISKYHGKDFSLKFLRQLSETTREGSSLYGISRAAEQIGMHTIGAKVNLDELRSLDYPLIIHWKHTHFVVLYKVKGDHFYISDPARGLQKVHKSEFLQAWIGPNAQDDHKGIILIVEPGPDFYTLDVDDPGKQAHKASFAFISHYLVKYRRFMIQLLIGVLVEGLLQVAFPLLTQSIVDVGIKDHNLNFVYLILLIQLMFMFGKVSVDVIKNWILLHLSTRINISLVSDFFMKLMKLPIGFFDSKLTGDLIQRIRDHDRIETLLTSGSLNIIFAIINLVVFSILLAVYSFNIFLLFWVGSLMFIGWVFLFIKKREKLDFRIFELNGKEHSKVIELINGMQEIKLHNVEHRMRWSWEYLKAALFKVKVSFLSLEQKQSVGGVTINELKNILITVYTAQLVINGQLSLGALLAISYIIGQLNNPIRDIINFIHAAHNAKLSLERISEIHDKEEEVSLGQAYLQEVPAFDALELRNVSFRYTGTIEPVLRNLNLRIPHGKTTAIVGPSGSGKTTLMKLLLKFYEPEEGEIVLGTQKLNHISHEAWREYCGVVMQEGFIFNNTIAFNIALDDEKVDYAKLAHAARIAEIKDFIESKPLGYNTKIGQEGIGLSTGQKQRILIARAVYKNPEFILFDEATSALDANNEKSITENLGSFLASKTAVVIAHRLSTVKKADNIVVIDEGQIIEEGSHEDLVARRGFYYHLVKNQLELENQTPVAV